MRRYYLALLLTGAMAASCAVVEPEPVKSGPVVYADKSVGDVSYGPLPEAFEAHRKTGGDVITSPATAPGKVRVSLDEMQKERQSRMVSLNAGDITVAQAVEMIRDVSKANIALRPSAATIKATPIVLENVEWMKALETIVRANGLVATMNGEDIFAKERPEPLIGANDVILISTYEDFLETQDRRKSAAGNFIELARRRRQAAEEDHYATVLSDTEERETRSYRFKYADPLEAVAYLKSLFADSQDDPALKLADNRRPREGHVADDVNTDNALWRRAAESRDVKFAVFKTDNLVTITAPTRLMPEIMKRIGEIDVRPKQVYIEARIVEIQRNHMRDLGIQWGGYATRTTGFAFPDTIGVSGAGESSTGGAQGVSLPPSSAVDPVTGAVLKDAQGAVLGVALGAASGSAVIQARLFAL